MKKQQKKETTYKAIIINGENILLFGDHVAKAPTSRILKGNARGLGTQNPVNIITIVQLIVKTIRNLDGLRRITILNNDQMIRLKKGPPHLQEIKIPDGGYHNIKLIFQQRGSPWHCSRFFRSCILCYFFVIHCCFKRLETVCLCLCLGRCVVYITCKSGNTCEARSAARVMGWWGDVSEFVGNERRLVLFNHITVVYGETDDFFFILFRINGVL